MSRFDIQQPDTIKDVIDLLDQHGKEAALLAGGTAILIDIKHGEIQPKLLISLWGLPDLRGIHSGSELRIGALTTMTEVAQTIENHPSMLGLKEAALLLGAKQIQNIATIGGNICKASPGADMVPPLLCLDAQLVLIGSFGERTVSLDGFLLGPDKSAINHCEILKEINIGSIPQQTGTAFLKIMRRHAVDCSIVAVAALITLDEDGCTCVNARISIAAAAPYPFRARRAEKIIIGEKLSGANINYAAIQAREESSPITDIRASANYRRLLVETLTKRAILIAADRAKQGTLSHDKANPNSVESK